MSVYTNLSKSVLRQINRYGRTVTIMRDDKGAYDPIAGAFTGDSNTAIKLKAVVVGYTVNEIDGEIIQRGDKKVLFAGNADIRKGDQLIDGDTFTILDIEEINPGDTKLLFKAQARK